MLHLQYESRKVAVVGPYFFSYIVIILCHESIIPYQIKIVNVKLERAMNGFRTTNQPSV